MGCYPVMRTILFHTTMIIKTRCPEKLGKVAYLKNGVCNTTNWNASSIHVHTTKQATTVYRWQVLS